MFFIQPTNEPTRQPTNQPTNEPTRQPTNQPTNGFCLFVLVASPTNEQAQKIVRKGEMIKLTFKNQVDAVYSRAFFRCATEGEAIGWHRALLLRREAVLLRDVTLQ